METIYLSGPMKGITRRNFPEFNKIASQLRKKGFSVINPAQINVGLKSDYKNKKEFYNACLKRDIRALVDCNSIVMMEGWEKSNGAYLELYIASKIGLSILFVNDLL